MQFAPLNGVRLVQVLVLLFTPCEHETEHMFQVRDSENFPSTAKLNTKNTRINVTADHFFLIDKVSLP